MNRIAEKVSLFIAQGAYAGKSPIAPGTAGTLVGVLIYLGMMHLSPIPYLAVTLLVCVVGTWVAGKAEVILGRKDASEIVIDEIAGYLISMFLVPTGWGYVVAAFFLFRVFDIAKPWPLFQMQAVRGGAGVMLDDIGAGVYTNIALQLTALMIAR